MKNIIVELIKEVLKSRSDQEIESIENKLNHSLVLQEDTLLRIAADSNELISIRAHAARLFMARNSQDPLVNHLLIDLLSQHQSPLIRLGVMLGCAEAGDFERVKLFELDIDETIRKEAKELLEEREKE